MSNELSTCGIKGLEIAMRDVLDGLEDTACYMNYLSNPDIVEILSIEAPGRPIPEEQKIISITQSLKTKHNCNIVDYLIQRELRKSA